MTVKRGEIYRVQFDPVKGSEQGGLCPAVVVQNDGSNDARAATVVVPMVRTVPPWPCPFAVIVEPKESGLSERSVIHCGQIATIQHSGYGSRLRPARGEPEVRAIGQLSAQKMAEVEAALRFHLALC